MDPDNDQDGGHGRAEAVPSGQPAVPTETPAAPPEPRPEPRREPSPDPATEVRPQVVPFVGEHAPGPEAIVLDLPVRETTGDPVVDEVLQQFDRVTGAPLDTHIEVGERVHQSLHGRLSDIGDS